MNDEEFGPKFWLANGILAVAMLMLLFMGRLWELMGPAAMVLWIALAGTGAYLLMYKGPKNPQ